ncbi:BRCA1-associated protein [Trypanosoma theileri]|uniref:BRCA1-associated protein n=1 Tax=Trypanosoma theileri TaxID=67003 RepID=A0A1X0PAX0_9TRYP|nr:BRCA1-associated protein [Trypanosoma theileri]ORC93729.1 BRCA1-associated protein [Trypanosoma theileri]
MLRYDVTDVLCEDQTCELPGDCVVRAVVGRVVLLRRLKFKREFFVPFVPTRSLLLVFPTRDPLDGEVLRPGTVEAVARYLRWLADGLPPDSPLRPRALLACTHSGCTVMTLDCADVLTAIALHARAQEDDAPVLGTRRVMVFPCDQDEEHPGADYYVVPTCTICAERLEPTLTGYTARTCRCDPPSACACMTEHSSCVVCTTLLRMQRGGGSNVPCEVCHLAGDPWICLVCGFVGCSRYQAQHAKHHFLQERHFFSMSLLTQQIWDYDSDAFVHRVVVLFDTATGAMQRVQYPDRDNLPSSLVDDTGDTVTAEKANKKHINAKYDSKVETSNETLALMIKHQLDTSRAEYESEHEEQQRLQKQGKQNLSLTLQKFYDIDATEIYSKMNLEKEYGGARQRWLSLFLGNRNLDDEVQQCKCEVSRLTELLNELNSELRSVVEYYATGEHRLLVEIADLEETIKEVETNVRMRKQLENRLGGDSCQTICVMGDGNDNSTKKTNKQKKQKK